MNLRIRTITVQDIRIEREAERPSTFCDGVLTVNEKDLRRILLDDDRLADVSVRAARPGDATRIVPVKDVIEPRCKLTGRCFPGLDGPIEEVGTDTTIALKGCAVVTTGPIVGFQEGVIDMSGPLARYSPFSTLLNIVLVIGKKDGVNPHEHEEAVRVAGIKAAQYLAETGKACETFTDTDYAWDAPAQKAAAHPALPKVGYVYLCTSQGLLHDNYFYGKNLQGMSPSLISPLEILDGALVSGNCVSPGSKSTTYHHQNNAIIDECFRRHGKTINFFAVVLVPMLVRLEDKVRNSLLAARTLRLLGVDAAVVSMEGFGNPTTDLMMCCRKLEQRGIKTVILTNEDAGLDGFSESLPDGTPEADAIVSTGNSNEILTAPAMAEIIGDLSALARITGGGAEAAQADGQLVIETHAVMGSHNLQGYSCLSAITV